MLIGPGGVAHLGLSRLRERPAPKAPGEGPGALIAQTLAAIRAYGPRWFVVAEAGYDRAWLTYIKNSDWYRTTFYSDPKDRWYSGTAACF